MASSHAKFSPQSERGIHDMISKLTDRLVSLGQGTPEHEHNHHSHHDTDQGVRIITLAGENKGTAMKATSLDELVDTQGMIYNDENVMSAYTNSNYQAVNNSIMLEGKCSAEDPGVHIIITHNFDDDSSSSDDSDSDSDSERSDEEDKKGKKGKKKESKKKKEGKKKGKEKKEKEKKGQEKKGTSKKEDNSESEEEEKGKHKEKGKVVTN